MISFKVRDSAITLPAIHIGLAALLLTPTLAQSHGNQPHDSASKNKAIIQEQMPWGVAGASQQVSRTVHVSMHDHMRFDPPGLQVEANETVRFVVKNEGQILHEFVLGTLDSNAEHAELMKKFPNMEHDAPYMAHVEPGRSTEIIWKFNRSGQFEFACLIAGHYDAGMRGELKVSD